MRKTIYTALLLMVLSVSAFAFDERTADKEVKVTSHVVKRFEADFATATAATWTVVDNMFKVSFILDGVQTSAFYDWENNHIATTNLVNKDVLSAKAIAWMTKNYKDYQIGSVIKHFDGATNYFVDLKKDDKEVIVRVSGDYAFFFKRLK